MKNGFFHPWGEDIDAGADFDLKQSFPPQLHYLHQRQMDVLNDILAELNIGIWPTDGHDQENPDGCRLVNVAFGPGDCWAGNIDLAHALTVGLADHNQCGPKSELIALRKVRAVIDEAIAARVAVTTEET